MTKLNAIQLTQGPSIDTDGLVLLFRPESLGTKVSIKAVGSTLVSIITEYLACDKSASSTTSLLMAPNAPGKRVVLSPIGSLLGDTDDVRKFGEAASAAIKKCKRVGIIKPMVLILENPFVSPTPLSQFKTADYEQYLQVILLGLLSATYVPLQHREFRKVDDSIQHINVAVAHPELESKLPQVIEWVEAVESGRALARDLGGSDPERMTPLKCAAFIEQTFAGISNIKLTVITDPEILKKEFPLLHAVARCSLSVPGHCPAVVRLEYHAADQSQVKEK